MKAVITETITYWKYVDTNLNSLVSGSNVTVNPTNIAPAVGNGANTAIGNSNSVVYYTFTFNLPTKINTVIYIGWVVANARPYAKLKQIQAYNTDSSSWVTLWSGSTVNSTISVSNTNYYTQYRIGLAGSEAHLYGTMGVNRVDMKGVQRTVVQGTPQDYSYSITTFTSKLYKETIQQEVTRTIQYNNASSGTVSGSNFWTGRVQSDDNWSWHTKTGTITYGSNQRAGTWTLNYKAWRQSNSGLEMTVIINYADGTTATVYTKTDFPNNNTEATYTGTITATKAWKGYTIQMRGKKNNDSYAYSGIGAVNYIKTSYTETANVDIYKAFNV